MMKTMSMKSIKTRTNVGVFHNSLLASDVPIALCDTHEIFAFAMSILILIDIYLLCPDLSIFSQMLKHTTCTKSIGRL